MIRGTTPTHIFKLPIDTSEICKVRITYRQSGKTVLEKTEQDITMDGDTISYQLTQEESLTFGTANAELQVKVLTSSGNVMASNIIKLSIGEILNTEVLV